MDNVTTHTAEVELRWIDLRGRSAAFWVDGRPVSYPLMDITAAPFFGCLDGETQEQLAAWRETMRRRAARLAS